MSLRIFEPRILFVLAVSFLTVILFQNCGPGFKTQVSEKINSSNSGENLPLSCPVENGKGEQVWLDGQYSPCQVIECNSGFRNESGTCVFSASSCPITYGNGQLQSDNSCRAIDCISGYHLAGNTCAPDLLKCTIANGTGQSIWNGQNYGACLALTCNPGFQIVGGVCQAVIVTTPKPPQDICNSQGSCLHTGTDQRIAIDSKEQYAYLASSASLYRIDLRTGFRSVVSDFSFDFSQSLGGGVVLLDDQTALTYASPALVKIDLVSGKKTIVSSPTVGVGPALTGFNEISLAVNSAKSFAYLAQRSASGTASTIVKVNLNSGDRSVLTSVDVGLGPVLDVPYGLAVDKSDKYIYVAEASPLRRIMRVDLATGERAVVASPTMGVGPAPNFPRQILLGQDGKYLLYANLGKLVRVDIATGDRAYVPSSLIQSDIFALTKSESRVYFIGNRQLFKIDFGVDTAGVVLSDSSLGSGPTWDSSPAMLVGPVSQQIYVLSMDGRFPSSISALMKVDPRSGNRTLIPNLPAGIFQSNSIAIDRGENFVYGFTYTATNLSFQNLDNQIFRVNLITGARSVVSGNSVGVGPNLGQSLSSKMVLSDNGQTLYLLTFRQLWKVDVATGNRSIVSDTTTPNSAPIDNCYYDLTVNKSETLAYLSCVNRLLKVDLSTGVRTVVATPSSTAGVAWPYIPFLLLSADEKYLLGGSVIFDVANGNQQYLKDSPTGMTPFLGFPLKSTRSGLFNGTHYDIGPYYLRKINVDSSHTTTSFF